MIFVRQLHWKMITTEVMFLLIYICLCVYISCAMGAWSEKGSAEFGFNSETT